MNRDTYYSNAVVDVSKGAKITMLEIPVEKYQVGPAVGWGGAQLIDLANYSSNTAQENEDGTYTLSFGCGEDAINNLEVSNPSKVFNIAVRHYQPSKRVLEDDYRLVPLLKAVPYE